MPATLLHPRLADCRRLFLRDYRVAANIGIYDFEKRGAQTIVVDVDLFIPLTQSTAAHDKISEVFDYDMIRDAINERVGTGHINLLETLCDDVARRLLGYPLVRAVRVAICKPDVYTNAEGIGVEVFHIKENGA